MADFSTVCSRANLLMIVFYFMILVDILNAVMLKKECPVNESHRSCWFYEEYTCWEDERKEIRVMKLPKRLTHCIPGCFCKNGFVREYPNGPCIQAPHCFNERIRHFLSKLPA